MVAHGRQARPIDGDASPIAPTRPESSPPPPDAAADLSSFIREITDLAERLLPQERGTILNVARKLAGQRR